MYRIVFTKRAQKQYEKLPSSHLLKTNRTIANLSLNPFAGKKLKGKLKEYYSLRVWPHRILYEIISSPKTVVIIAIAHRQGVYN